MFVLTDDLSLDLLLYMPHVLAMERAGMTFDDYFVSDSLCCPSRASIFTGNFPHDTRIFTNVSPDGGFGVFHARAEEDHTFATALQSAGYRTAMMGKYLNRYMQVSNVPKTYEPPGWSEWDVAGWGYPEFNYTLNQNGTLHHHGHAAKDYLTNVIANKGIHFIDRATRDKTPFMLELATFAPHSPYTPAPRDRHLFKGLTAPEPQSFDTLPSNPPLWLAQHQPLRHGQIAEINRVFRKRAQAVQAVDRMIGRIETTLAADRAARDTYLVFSSDNGLHTGEYRLMPGKLTAFDTDIHVPLVVVGPGVRPASHTDAMTENIDLAPTFAGLGGVTFPADGQSLEPLLAGQAVPGWPNAILVEHHGPDMRGGDPDYQQPAAGNPRSYEAVRTHDFLYVLYDDNERAYYDLRDDPYELQNLAPELTPAQITFLKDALDGIESCHDQSSCALAMEIPPLPAGFPRAAPALQSTSARAAARRRRAHHRARLR